MDENSRIWVAGHRGLVGSAIVRQLQAEGHRNLILRDRTELDLRNQAAVERFFAEERPEFVFLAAAKVGGIWANAQMPGEFIRDNLLIQTLVIDACQRHGCKKLLFLGSSCIYPKHAPQPMREEHLLTGPLEPTNEPYAIAKIAGIRMVQAYAKQFGLSAVCLMPTNLYGPGDNFDLETSHVLPALIRRFDDAKRSGAAEVRIWGTGRPRREFLHVDDLARASLFLMRRQTEFDLVNVGVGEDIAIADLAALIANIVGYTGAIGFDSSKPDGTPRKLLDIGRLAATGFRPSIGLAEGIASTYRWYLREVRGEQTAD